MIFSELFDRLEHEAKPLLSAAAKWAEGEGIKIVKDVEADLRAVAPDLLATAETALKAAIPALSSDQVADLITTGLARVKAAATATLRASVLNAGVEQAVLLAKGQAGDTQANS